MLETSKQEPYQRFYYFDNGCDGTVEIINVDNKLSPISRLTGKEMKLIHNDYKTKLELFLRHPQDY